MSKIIGNSRKAYADKKAKTDGTSYVGAIEVTYLRLVEVFGKPNGAGDNYKTDAKWTLTTDHGVATIYNWKNGKNYCGEEGDEVEDITDWHIGGKNNLVVDDIKEVLELF